MSLESSRFVVDVVYDDGDSEELYLDQVLEVLITEEEWHKHKTKYSTESSKYDDTTWPPPSLTTRQIVLGRKYMHTYVFTEQRDHVLPVKPASLASCFSSPKNEAPTALANERPPIPSPSRPLSLRAHQRVQHDRERALHRAHVHGRCLRCNLTPTKNALSS